MLKSILRPTLVGVFLFLIVAGVQAATLTVTNTFDSGSGSLRQAIIDATGSAESDTVTFSIPTTDPGYDIVTNRFTISLVSELPSIPVAPFTLSNTQPEAVTVRGNGTFRIFTIADNAVVTFNNLTITNGFSGPPVLAKGASSLGGGGGIYVGNSSTLDLNDSVVTSNTAEFGGGAVFLSSGSSANVSKTTISTNSSPNGDGGAFFVNDNATLNIDMSTVNDNSASNGGAIFNNIDGTIVAATSTFDANSAFNVGGAICSLSTITLTNNTITSNSADTGGGIYNDFTATLNSNIVALNSAGIGTDLGGSAYTGEYNLIGNADDSIGLASAPNISGTTGLPIDPVIGPLQDNGGNTMTRALITSSPAIDTGSTALTMDQREALRPFDSAGAPNGPGNATDIGAYEYRLGPSSSRVTVSGRVYLSSVRCERGVAGLSVSLLGLDGSDQVTYSDSNGNYKFTNALAGSSYIVSVRSREHIFDAQIIVAGDNMGSVDFVKVTEGLFKCTR